MTTLGFIGTGGMGSGMAANLIKAGYKLVVTDLNRAQAKALEAAGATFVNSPKDVAEACDLVLSMLPYNAAVTAVALGKGGLCEATRGAKVWIDFSSIDKATIVAASGEIVQEGLDRGGRVGRRRRGGRCGGPARAVGFGLEGAVRRIPAGVQADGASRSSTWANWATPRW